jgi:hypothetical protein
LRHYGATVAGYMVIVTQIDVAYNRKTREKRSILWLASREHFPRYANEFAFRWNTRQATDGQRLQRFIERIAGKRLTYRQVAQPLCVC